MCDWSMTSEPLSSSWTFVALAMAGSPLALEDLADADELRGARGAELLHALGRVVEEPAPGLDAEPALVAQVGRGLRDPGLVGEVLVQEARDARVDVEPRHVEQLDRRDDGELVADAPLDAQVEALGVDHALIQEGEALAHDRVEHAVLDEARDLLAQRH